jgi:lipopolysaccharide transport system ATP-binding protein
MAIIEIHSGTLEFPVMRHTSHSFKGYLVERVGGVFSDKSSRMSFIKALDNVNIKLTDGDRVGIVGHNGAGKTTLLRVISGAYPLTSGGIRCDGSVQALTDFTLGMDSSATGRQNIYLRLGFMGVSRARSREFIDDIILFSGLGEYIDFPVYTYSTGMYLRLAFSISTCFEPDILVMDEVIGAGDESFRNKASERVKSLVARSNILVLSSHGLATIREFCNRVIVMEAGRIVFDGSVEGGFEYYSNSAQSKTK